MKLRRKRQILSLLLVLMVVPCVCMAEPERLTAPTLEGYDLKTPLFANDEIVSQLGALLQEPDSITRATATRNLGETNNSNALMFIAAAMDDKEPTVRSAAAIAAGGFDGEQSEKLVLRALGDESSVVVLAAMRTAAKLKLTNAPDALQKQLANDDALVRANALKTLTALDKFAGDANVLKLLDDSSTGVRLAAAENSLTPAEITPQLFDKLCSVAKSTDTAAVRGACVASVGKHNAQDPSAAALVLSNAYNDESPVVRRAAVQGYFYLGNKSITQAALDDKSPLVRLTAIIAAGKLKDTEAVTRISSLMISTPDEKTHIAARDALLQVGTLQTQQLAAKTLKTLTDKLASFPGGKLTESQDRAKHLLNRNAVACCYILGELRTHEGYDTMLQLLTSLEINSPIVGEIAIAMGKIGDKRAIAPLVKVLALCKVRGFKTLVAIASMSQGPPFSSEVTINVIEALGVLDAKSAAKLICDTGKVSYGLMRLPSVAAAAAATLPKLAGPDDREMVEKFITGVLADKLYKGVPQFYAGRTAGQMKIKPAVQHLKVILNEQRPTLLLMQAAAWAIQEIEGKTPKIPNPINNQGDWILTLVKRNEN